MCLEFCIYIEFVAYSIHWVMVESDPVLIPVSLKHFVDSMVMEVEEFSGSKLLELCMSV